jgi:hypothetical protein
MSDSWRFYAQRAVTNVILDRDVPLTLSAPPHRDLSGPGNLDAVVTPELMAQIASDGRPLLDEWSTIIYAEADDQIRWGGILQSLSYEGSTAVCNFAGFTSYLSGIPFLGNISAGLATTSGKTTTISPQVDTFDVVRSIWSHVQAQPDGNLGMVVDTEKSGIMLGAKDGTDPYQLVYWEAPDCGQEIDTLAQTAPFDYTETHSWTDATKTAVHHQLNLGYPRLGRRRTDLRFVQGENISQPVQPSMMGTDFANEVYSIGKGEGRKALRSRMVQRDGRLRRVYVMNQTGVGSQARLDTSTRTQLKARTQAARAMLVAVREHPNAPVGSWALGDDILVKATLPWVGDFSAWHRVVGDDMQPNGESILTLVRSDLLPA